MPWTLKSSSLAVALLLAMRSRAFCDLVDVGKMKFQNRHLPDAITAYTNVIELGPDLADACYNRALMEQLKGDLDGALLDYTKAIALKPDFSEAYCNRSHVLSAKGDLDRAVKDCDQFVRLKSDLADSYNNRGAVKQLKGDLTGARVDFEKAITVNPSSHP